MTDADSTGMLICKLNRQEPLSYQFLLFAPSDGLRAGLKELFNVFWITGAQFWFLRFLGSTPHLERHIARMKRIYSKRRKCLIARLYNIFGSRVKISGDAADMHLVAKMTGSLCDPQVVAQLEELHIKIYPAEKYTIAKGRYEDRLIMGFGNVEEINIFLGDKGDFECLKDVTNIGAKSDFVGPINAANSGYLSIQELCYEIGDCLNTTPLFHVGRHEELDHEEHIDSNPGIRTRRTLFRQGRQA